MVSEQRLAGDLLLKEIEKLERRVHRYLRAYSSPRVSHHARALAELRSAIREDVDAAEARLARIWEKAQRREQDAEQRSHTTHERAMADKLGITAAEFVAIQQERKFVAVSKTEVIGDVRPDGSIVGIDLEPMEDPNDD